MTKIRNSRQLDIGWCEWVSFPALRIPAIEAKVIVDSHHSMLTIFDYSTFKEGENLMISFGVHPIQDTDDIEVYTVVPVKTRKLVTFADGSRDWCYVIETEMRIGSMKKTVDLTLVKREDTTFRLHIAAKTIKNLVKINPHECYLTGQLLNGFAAVGS